MRLFLQNLSNRLFTPVDGASLAFFRIVFGLIMLSEVVRYFDHGWIDRYWIEPDFHFKYFGFSWVQPWPGSGMRYHFIGLGILAGLISLGLFYRVAAALFFLGFSYTFLIDQATHLNHFYLVCLVSGAMAFIPANRVWSLDSLLRKRQGAPPVVPLWSVVLIAFIIGLPYFFGGVAKINGDWLHGEPVRDWLSSRQDFPLIGRFFTKEWMVYSFVYGGLFLDLLVVPFLLWKRTRPIAFCFALGFHLMNVKLFSIGIFPWFMMAATPIFFSPSWPRHLLVGPLRRWRRDNSDISAMPHFPKNKWVLSGIAVFALVQTALPLRHFFYPGNVSWTEDGHRFAWHMKLRSKDSTIRFHVLEPETQLAWLVDPEQVLSPRQARKMPSRPDMIIQFSHHLVEKFEKIGHKNVEVRAISAASLNGRGRQVFVDPTVDLSKEKRDLGKVSWVIPLLNP